MKCLETIVSRDNKYIKEVKKLQERKYRDKSGLFLIEGFRFTEEALKNNEEIMYMLIDEEHISKFLGQNLHIKDTHVFYVKTSLFKEIASTENSQGVLAVVKKKEKNPKDKSGIFVLADRIQDPGNMGTIIRTAHAVGADGIITTKGTVDIYNNKTLRSTMGSIFYIPVIEDDLDLSYVKKLKSSGYSLAASSLASEFDFYDVALDKKIIIAIGNEGSGISNEIMELSDINFKIPMPGGAESLNAAVSCSVILYETLRQKHRK